MNATGTIRVGVTEDGRWWMKDETWIYWLDPLPEPAKERYMDTTQKAPILVTQTDGTPVTSFTTAIDDPTVAQIQALGPDTFLVALTPGSGTLTVTSGVQEGVLPFTVTAAPLVITLGPAVPKG